MCASEKYTPRVQKLREEYWLKIKDVKAENLVFIDESGVNLVMTRRQARAIKGERAYGDMPHQRGKNVTLIGAIACQGLLAQINLLGATDGLTFEAFIVRHLIPVLWEGAVVIIDNASIHQEKYLRPLIEEIGAFLEFLPPYSPDFSPIENCWSKLKSILRAIAPRTYQELEQAIVKGFEQISLKDIHNWFTHCCYCDQPYSEAQLVN